MKGRETLKQPHLEHNLYTYFHKCSFLPGQKEVIEDVLAGKDVLGILPTGSGKSLCYQLPARMLTGATIVVSPLISLMTDQVKQLKASHFKEVIALNSFMNPAQRKAEYPYLDAYKLIYISPELLQHEEILFWLEKIRVSLFVIDEAHCISQWGHEFRPDYFRLNEVIHALSHPAVLALTATAPQAVRNDIMHALNKPEMEQHIYPVDRDNIIYDIKKVTNDHEKTKCIADALQTHHIPTIIYFSSRQLCERMTETLSQYVPSREIAYYHGGMEQLDRTLIQQQFMHDQIDVICATSAFGMGLDKQNVRMVIHYHLPGELESFIQETGRAGRDGKSSVSLLLYSENDEEIQKGFISRELPSTDEADFVWERLYKLEQNKQPIPTDEVQIRNYFQISEVQWRFLFYQMKKHGMIKKGNIIYHKKHWQEVLGKVKSLIYTRMEWKEKQLKGMLDWIFTTDCLRKELYKHFQRTYTIPDGFCCSNCGFLHGNWEPDRLQSERESASWKENLQKILLGNVSK